MWFQNITHGSGSPGYLMERIKNQRKKLESRKNTDYHDETDILSSCWDSELDDGE